MECLLWALPHQNFNKKTFWALSANFLICLLLLCSKACITSSTMHKDRPLFLGWPEISVCLCGVNVYKCWQDIKTNNKTQWKLTPKMQQKNLKLETRKDSRWQTILCSHFIKQFCLWSIKWTERAPSFAQRMFSTFLHRLCIITKEVVFLLLFICLSAKLLERLWMYRSQIFAVYRYSDYLEVILFFDEYRFTKNS